MLFHYTINKVITICRAGSTIVGVTDVVPSLAGALTADTLRVCVGIGAFCATRCASCIQKTAMSEV